MKGFSPTVAILAATLLHTAVCAADPDLQWIDLYDGGGSYIDLGVAAIADPLGNLVVGGESADGVDGADLSIRKLSRDAHEPIWSARYAAFDGNDMAFSGMVWDPFGDILIGGYIRGCVG